VIPHKIDKETINLKTNTCMKCHSEKTYEQKKAPKVGDSHYVARDGKVLETVSTRRYFCNQCHAPQLNAEPIVINRFEGAK
jgi:cytochrome c-type protein NapB